MKKIDKEFQAYGWNFKQIEREGHYAIYKQSRSDIDKTYYEVVEIRTRKHSESLKHEREEHYPSKSKWGVYGWTFGKKETAEKVFQALLNGATGDNIRKMKV